jgi:hypothetical protein
MMLNASSALAGSVTYNFDTDPSAILDIRGAPDTFTLPRWQAKGGNPATGGFLAITYSQTYMNTHIVFQDLDPGKVVTAFTFDCDLRVGNSTGARAADGFSISFARSYDPVLDLWETDPGRGYRGDYMSGTCPACENASLPETGTSTGIAISFDTWSGNTLPDGADVEGIIVVVDNKTVTRYALPTRHGACDDATSLQTGPRDADYWAAGGDPTAPEAWATLCWQPLHVELDDQGKLSVTWKGATILDKYQTAYFPTAGRLVFGGRTGGANEQTHVDNIKLTTTAVVGESEPPTDPTNLKATEVGARRIVLTWDPSVDRPNPAAKVAYEIEKDGAILTGLVTAPPWEDRDVTPTSTHTYRVRAMDLNSNKSGWASATVTTVAEVPTTGWVSGKIYDNISGTPVDNLINDAKYPNSPDRDAFHLRGLTFGEPNFGNTFGENLGVRIAGTLTPPETGQYDFFVRSDDASRFYLNQAGAAIPDPFVDTPIAEETGCCNAFFETGIGASQTTVSPISLQAGKQYGFLFLVKEGGGGDWGQVAWRKVGDPTPASSLPPISGVYVLPEGGCDPVGASVTITKDPEDATVIANESVTFTAAADFTSPWTTTPIYQWYKNGTPILNATSPTLTIPVASTADNGAKIKFLASVPGAAVYSKEATLTVQADTKPPTIVSVHGSDTFTAATVKFSEPVTDPSATTVGNYSLSGGLTVSAVTRVDLYTVRLTTSTQTAGAEYTLTVNNVRDNAGNSIAANSTATLYAFVGGNGIAHRYWEGITVNTIETLTSDPRFPNNPTWSSIEPLFEYPPNGGGEGGSNYGNMLFGWLYPPETGDYIFFTCSDDPSNLYLSTDDNPANKKLIAQESGWSDPRQWHSVGGGSTLSDKRSDTFAASEWPTPNKITLQAGKSYYIEVVHTEGGGGDNVGVAWKTPSGSVPANGAAPISKDYVKAYIDPAAGAPVIKTQPKSVAVAPGGNATLSVEVSMGERPFSYQWRLFGKPVAGATDSTLTLNNITADMAGIYTVVVSNPAGSVTSDEAAVILDGTFVIEAEDFNYDGGKYNPKKGTPGLDVDVMPYLGGAYAGLSAKQKIDYDSNDGEDDTSYRAVAPSKGGTQNKDMNDNMGGRFGKYRGKWDVTVNYKLGWVDTADWGNYTRTFPSGSYQVWAALSHGNGPSDATALRGKLERVTAGVTTTEQTREALGKFVAPGTGGWGRNTYVPMTDDSGVVKTVQMGGEQTVRFTMDSGDFDYLLFVPAAAAPPEAPRFTSITMSADGKITVAWEGGGTLQATTSLTPPIQWQDVTSTSPYTFTPEGSAMFGRIKK